jgi:hypothetical protein
LSEALASITLDECHQLGQLDPPCDPWSLWAIVWPAGGRRRQVAICTAPATSSARLWSAIDHPTTRRDQASMTTGRNEAQLVADAGHAMGVT